MAESKKPPGGGDGPPTGKASDSTALDSGEREQAADHAAPAALVIHEIVRHEGEVELQKSTSSILWSGFAAGLSMGFSFLSLALVQSALPDAPWRPLLAGFGYSVGFIIVVMGRQELFTESTLTAVLPVLVRRDRQSFGAVLRFWGLVLAANGVGTLLFAALISMDGLFSPAVHDALLANAVDAVSGPFFPTLVKSVLSGWLIALMVWILPSAKSERLFVIVIITYIVAIGHFSHVIAGSVEAFFAVFSGKADIGDYLMRFLLPTIVGNTTGGVAFVAILNHAPIATQVRNDA